MTPARNVRSLNWCYAWTILISAFLVFQVQPVISKFILPWFGGSPAVWTTCMLFFQVVLFAGYGYAHASTRLLRPRLQGILHLILIVLALWLVPITPTSAWKPLDGHHPTWRILCLLAANVGVPYLLLSSTGPLVQAWFARTSPERSPYRLYALSNLGSLLALLSYPFVVEPLWGSAAQSRAWSLGFAVFGLCCGYCAWRLWCERLGSTLQSANADTGKPYVSTTAEVGQIEEPAPSLSRHLTWMSLAACASLMLLATTNHVCQDVAVIPFLWVVPLSLYLVTFIICFENPGSYSSRFCGLGAAASILAVSLLMIVGPVVNLACEVAVYFTALFFICMLCHGELVRRKPGSQYLTSFYLMCSAGGALGGILVAVIAPLVFSSYLELNLGLFGCYLLAIAALAASGWFARGTSGRMVHGVAAFVGLLVVVHSQAGAVAIHGKAATRSFYGLLSVDELDANDPAEHRRMMLHGRISHGTQYLSPAKRRTPTFLYGKSTGIGLTFRSHAADRPRRVGVVGLGVGVIAAYGQQHDYFRFYEINPDVERLARSEFTFLADCPAQVDCVLGDARLSMERESPQEFDILVLDAFSGDAIPTHLLTSEALTIYLRHLKPDGVLAVHISNRHVDLVPVIRGLAEGSHLGWAPIETTVDFSHGEKGTGRWALLTRDKTFFMQPDIREVVVRHAAPPAVVWTDDYSNLFQILE
jgi:hypothetical protein